MGKFIWSSSGKILRVSVDELKLAPEKGGLGLPCLDTMSKSLILSQLLRMLKSEDYKSIGHVSFWIGRILDDLLPDMLNGTYAAVVPAFYIHLAEIVADALISETITPLTWKSATNKSIYHSHSKHFQLTKIEQESEASMNQVWKKILSPSLSAEVRETLYLLIHNKLPIKERMFHINLANDPYCNWCLADTPGEICDRFHMFSSCVKIKETWEDIKLLIDPLLPQKNVGSNLLLLLDFNAGKYEAEISWLLGNYVREIWTTFVKKRRAIRRAELFGFLKFKFKSDQLGARYKMKNVFNFQ